MNDNITLCHSVDLACHQVAPRKAAFQRQAGGGAGALPGQAALPTWLGEGGLHRADQLLHFQVHKVLRLPRNLHWWLLWMVMVVVVLMVVRW